MTYTTPAEQTSDGRAQFIFGTSVGPCKIKTIIVYVEHARTTCPARVFECDGVELDPDLVEHLMNEFILSQFKPLVLRLEPHDKPRRAGVGGLRPLRRK
ncbi:hypothetical protein EVAR_48033_1 [Eumeta japonica]|uniref:Uncharacterized protein n=1 Tax=Eumeta variegata TaxID=151549 RepID=A0A4C1XGZ1_EUMVA|nr:hypothetical protein EVAR_48033_1 [Eumeta japonica]